MPKVEKGGLERPVDIHIRIVRNGVTVRGCQEGREMEYVYKSLPEALKEVKGLVTVLQESESKPTKDELDKEESRLEGDY